MRDGDSVGIPPTAVAAWWCGSGELPQVPSIPGNGLPIRSICIKVIYPMLDVLEYTAQQTREGTGRCRGSFRLDRRVAFTCKPEILLINASGRWQR
jgi:hypothetical protein